MLGIKLEEFKDEEVSVLLDECNASEEELKENLQKISKIINIIENKQYKKIKQVNKKNNNEK
jgi:hypothetical protein